MRPLPILLATAILAATAAIILAGPLDPPVGQVSSTFKTLSDVEPRIAISSSTTPGDADSVFRITQPGSYYLSANVSSIHSIGKHGIEVATSDVTIDLNGFMLQGGAGSLSGVRAATADLSNITVTNGTVRTWGQDGVDLGSLVATSCRLVGVRAVWNGGAGLRIGPGGEITGCIARGNQSDGISTSAGCTVTECAATDNAGTGFSVEGSTIGRCTSSSNGYHGLYIGSNSNATGCAISGNAFDGIYSAHGCTISGNTCTHNGFGDGVGANIRAGGRNNRVEANNCTQADYGILVEEAGNVVFSNTCSDNTVNWSIAADNVYGPIIDRSNASTPAVHGNAATDATGSTHPRANFTY